MIHDLDISSPDVTDLIAEISPRTVFHLAAQADVRVSVERPVFDAGVNVIGSRLRRSCVGDVYGPRQDPNGEAGVVAIFSGRFLEGEPPLIYGDGQQTRDFVFVGDVADAFVSAETEGSRLVANIGTGLETTLSDLFGMMASLTGWEDNPRYAPTRIGELRRSALDPVLAKRAIGWKPATSLRDGLSQPLDWFKQRRKFQSQRISPVVL